MTLYQTSRGGPFAAWRSTVALWSNLAQAPSQVAMAQAQATIRLMRAVAARPAAQAVAPVAKAADRPVALAAVPEPVTEPAAEPVPHGAPAEASPAPLIAATVEDAPREEAAALAFEGDASEPLAILTEPEPESLVEAVVHGIQATGARAAETPVLALVGATVEPAKAARPAKSRAPSGGSRARKPRRG